MSNNLKQTFNIPKSSGSLNSKYFGTNKSSLAIDSGSAEASTNSSSSISKKSSKHISFSINELKLNALQEPTTPIDKLNTPRTVTISNAFFPPFSPTSPNPDHDFAIAGKKKKRVYLYNFNFS